MKKLLAMLMLLGMVGYAGAADKDMRQKVKLPEQMHTHMLGNMRDHLQALSEIQVALAAKQLDRAADIAETRIGMTSLASHMAHTCPKACKTSVSRCITLPARFARTAHEGDGQQALENLAQVTQQGVACHAGYRTGSGSSSTVV